MPRKALDMSAVHARLFQPRAAEAAQRHGSPLLPLKHVPLEAHVKSTVE
jgi:hypothetical protein